MFLSVGFWLLDLPHLVVSSIKRCCNKDPDKEFVDTYAFDLGYHMSYGLTVFQIGLLFANIVPIIPAFCIVFFMFKYYVDKYNLSFVYNSEFQGIGKLKRNVIPLAIFVIILFQAITMGYFAGSISGNDPESTKHKKKTYLYFGLLVIFIEIMTCAYVRYKLYRKRRQ